MSPSLKPEGDCGANIKKVWGKDMSAAKRTKTLYPGVYFIGSIAVGTNKPDKIYYIRYRKNGKLIEEKAGRQSQDMTPSRASTLRGNKIKGAEKTNKIGRASCRERV